jgi:hypothetical protein
MRRTKKKAARPKPIWVKVGPGREKLVYGKEAERIRGIARHSGKEMHAFHVNPVQTGEFNDIAKEAAIDVEFKGGKCFAGSRRAQQEWAYFRNQYVNTDGGYYETIKESRKRELDRLAGR